VPKKLVIGDTAIAPGEQIQVSLPIASLPTRTPVVLPVHVFRSHLPGPSVVLSAGIHGNELNGIEIIRRLLVDKALMPKIGTVIALPAVNLFGFLQRTRELPDGRDLNRSFPGNKDGSLAAQLAYVLTHEILPHAQYGIDFHTGAARRSNFPQIRCFFGSRTDLELANAFGAPFTVNSRFREDSYRERAFREGKNILVFEGGESLRFDNRSIEVGMAGTLRLLRHLGMAESAPPISRKPVQIQQSIWLRAKSSGLWRPFVANGEAIRKKQLIGSISDPFGESEHPIRAKEDGYVLGINNLPVINKGDALIHIGR